MKRLSWSVAFLAGAGTLLLLIACAPTKLLEGEKKLGISAAVSLMNFPQAQTSSTPSVFYSLPARLNIEKIGVNAPIAQMGLTSEGNMEVPDDIHKAGWYKLGSRPGNKGSAVIAGHLDGRHGEPGIFSDLHKLQKGDTFSVTDDQGMVSRFLVREARSYPQSAHPPEVFNETSGKHLNLITCIGSWDTAAGSYSERLVVFGDKVE